MMDFIYANTELVIFVILIWTLPWKAVALWRAARRSQIAWFVVILFTNTLAILDILYIYVWSKKPKNLVR